MQQSDCGGFTRFRIAENLSPVSKVVNKAPFLVKNDGFGVIAV
jgi:hypothetical protein